MAQKFSPSDVRQLVLNIVLRSKKFALFLLLLLATFIYIYTHERNARIQLEIEQAKPPPIPDFDVVRERNKFEHPVYSEWISDGTYMELQDKDIAEKCQAYFNTIFQQQGAVSPGPDLVDLERLNSFHFDKLLYKKKKWFREKQRERRKALRKQGIKMKEEHERELKLEWVEASKALNLYEYESFLEMNHARVFGKCFVERTPADSEDGICALNERKVFPWLKKVFPKFEDWKGQKLTSDPLPVFDKEKVVPESVKNSECFLKKYKLMSNGKGIVIPLLPTYDAASNAQQIENIAKLIQVLRGLRNKLPIQVVYMNQNLKMPQKKAIIHAARTEISRLPDSNSEYLRLNFGEEAESDFRFTASEYPKQDLWFCDVTELKNKQQHPSVAKSYSFNSPSFMLQLAATFNSFEESIVLSSHAIPLANDFAETLFKKESYQSSGHLFFKSPSYPLKPRRFSPGFHEVTNLIKSYLMPSKHDNTIFGIHRRDSKIRPATNRVLEENFQYLLDPNVMVINKSKVLAGLMLGCNVQLYSILSTRIHAAKGELIPEFMWLGQEIAGTNKKVNFNRNFGVATGVLTPDANKPTHLVTLSSELCTSSWSQLDEDDDFTLLYTTSYQLENWKHNILFQESLEAKYTIVKKEKVDNMFDKNAEKVSMDVANKEVFDKTIAKNPMYIATALNPPVIDKNVVEQDAQEPYQAWLHQEEFAGYKGYPFWCAYNIVGSPRQRSQGRIIDYNDKIKARLNLVLDFWFRIES